MYWVQIKCASSKYAGCHCSHLVGDPLVRVQYGALLPGPAHHTPKRPDDNQQLLPGDLPPKEENHTPATNIAGGLGYSAYSNLETGAQKLADCAREAALFQSAHVVPNKSKANGYHAREGD